jgi:hypothetical protein
MEELSTKRLVISGRMGHEGNLVSEQAVYVDTTRTAATTPPASGAGQFNGTTPSAEGASVPAAPASSAFVAPPSIPAIKVGTSPRMGEVPLTAPPVPHEPSPDRLATFTGPLISSGLSEPDQTLELLPNESLVYQLGGLYLTSKRVILLAHGEIRSAFLHDIDAAGTRTERASVLNLLLGLLFLGASAGALITMLAGADQQMPLPGKYSLAAVAGLALILGLFLLGRYFLWVRRTLFVSVKGHPIIELSVSNWESRISRDMDAFVNRLFQIKDQMTREPSA